MALLIIYYYNCGHLVKTLHEHNIKALYLLHTYKQLLYF